MHFLSRDCEPTTFAGIIFHSAFRDFSVIKARKLYQTRCKTCPFDALAEWKTDRELTTATVNLEGVESVSMDKSLETNLQFKRF